MKNRKQPTFSIYQKPAHHVIQYNINCPLDFMIKGLSTYPMKEQGKNRETTK
jgi:hypothetical protein